MSRISCVNPGALARVWVPTLEPLARVWALTLEPLARVWVLTLEPLACVWVLTYYVRSRQTSRNQPTCEGRIRLNSVAMGLRDSAAPPLPAAPMPAETRAEARAAPPDVTPLLAPAEGMVARPAPVPRVLSRSGSRSRLASVRSATGGTVAWVRCLRLSAHERCPGQRALPLPSNWSAWGWLLRSVGRAFPWVRCLDGAVGLRRVSCW